MKFLFITEYYPGGGRKASVNSRERLFSGFLNDSIFLSPESNALGRNFYFKHYLLNRQKFPFNIYLIRLSVVDLLDFSWKVYKFITLGRIILKKYPEIERIVGVSDTGPAIVGTFLLSIFSRKSYSVIMFDLWRDNFLHPVDKLISIVFEGAVMRKAKSVISIGYGTANILKKRYGVNPGVIYHSTGIPLKKPKLKKISSPAGILYSGSIYWPQVEPLKNLIKAIETRDNVYLDIYSFQKIGDLKKIGVTGRHVNFHSPVTNKEMMIIQKKYDILFLPLFTSGKGKHEILAAHPGKLAEYLVSGVPIIVCAPNESFLADYASKNGFALVVRNNDPISLSMAINRLVDDDELRANLVKRAWKVAVINHDIKRNIHITRRMLAN